MTAKRFTSMYNEQSDMIQYVDILKEEPNKWNIYNVSETLEKLNELHEENEQLKKQLQREHTMLDNAILLERTRMGKNCLKQFREAIQ